MALDRLATTNISAFFRHSSYTSNLLAAGERGTSGRYEVCHGHSCPDIILRRWNSPESVCDIFKGKRDGGSVARETRETLYSVTSGSSTKEIFESFLNFRTRDRERNVALNLKIKSEVQKNCSKSFAEFGNAKVEENFFLTNSTARNIRWSSWLELRSKFTFRFIFRFGNERDKV